MNRRGFNYSKWENASGGRVAGLARGSYRAMHRTPDFKHAHERARTLKQMRESTSGRTHLMLQAKRLEQQNAPPRPNKTKSVPGVVDNFAIGAPWHRDDGYLQPTKANSRDSAISDSSPSWMHIPGVQRELDPAAAAAAAGRVKKKHRDSSVSAEAPAFFHIDGIMQNAPAGADHGQAKAESEYHGIDSAVSVEAPNWMRIRGVKLHTEPTKKDAEPRKGFDSAISRRMPQWMHVPGVQLRDIKRPGTRGFDPHDPAYVETHEELQDDPAQKELRRQRDTAWARSHYVDVRRGDRAHGAGQERDGREGGGHPDYYVGSPKAARRLQAAQAAARAGHGGLGGGVDGSAGGQDERDGLMGPIRALEAQLAGMRERAQSLRGAADEAGAALARASEAREASGRVFVDSCAHTGFLDGPEARARLRGVLDAVARGEDPASLGLPPALARYAALAAAEMAASRASRGAESEAEAAAEELRQQREQAADRWTDLRRSAAAAEARAREAYVKNAVHMGFASAGDAKAQLRHAKACPPGALRKLPKALADYARACRDLRRIDDASHAVEAALGGAIEARRPPPRHASATEALGAERARQRRAGSGARRGAAAGSLDDPTATFRAGHARDANANARPPTDAAAERARIIASMPSIHRIGMRTQGSGLRRPGTRWQAADAARRRMRPSTSYR
jgi:hypothetical protein